MSDKLIEALNSELAKRAYDEAVGEPLREVGGLTTDLLKALRLFTAPIQVAALWQERFQRYLERVRESVPVERQVEAPARIAGPALLQMRFLEEDDPLVSMYLELLSRSIDRDHQREAHPAFLKILEQLAPSEVNVLTYLRTNDVVAAFRCENLLLVEIVSTDYREFLNHRDELLLILDRLLNHDLVTQIPASPPIHNYRFSLSTWGLRFMNACTPRH